MNAPFSPATTGNSAITEDSWQELASHTVARIALGRWVPACPRAKPCALPWPMPRPAMPCTPRWTCPH
jgi:hypothetical protein